MVARFMGTSKKKKKKKKLLNQVGLHSAGKYLLAGAACPRKFRQMLDILFCLPTGSADG